MCMLALHKCPICIKISNPNCDTYWGSQWAAHNGVSETHSLGMQVAVIVNDMAEINIDAELIRSGEGSNSGQGEEVVELTNGCICCSLREDLVQEVARLTAGGGYDYLIIESTGESLP